MKKHGSALWKSVEKNGGSRWKNEGGFSGKEAENKY